MTNDVLSFFFYFQRNQNPHLSHLMQDLDFDERPTRRSKHGGEEEDDDDDLCAMMDRLPAASNKRR